MTNLDWRSYPPILRAAHISAIYGYTVNTVRKMWQLRSAKVPTPCQSRPYGVRREDARRHYERLSASVLVACLLFSGCASSSLGKGLDIGVGIAAAADYASTRYGIAQGGREVNPVMGDGPFRQALVKAAGAAGVIALADLVDHRGRHTLAHVVRLLAIAVWSAAAVHNRQGAR